MRGVFDDEEFVQTKAQRDTEVTLSTGTLLLLGLGLLLVCGACFGVGYAVGHHAAQPSNAANESQGAAPAMQGVGSQSKPSASALPAVTPPAQSVAAESDGAQPVAGAAQPAPAVAV